MTVAEDARITFLKIRELRKTMPQRTKAQRDELASKIKELQDQWWNRVRDTMVRPCPGTDSDYWKEKEDAHDYRKR